MAFFSTNSADYASAINALKKPTYESKYDNVIENQLNKILNREEFSYDFNADPLYQQYKDQYTKLGKEASMNAAASASSLTGGYGNSYAGTAASQANQQYLTELNNQIPELMNAAMDKYKMETENLYNQFGALEQEEGRQYGMYRDSVSDYYNDWSMLQNGFGIAQAQENYNKDFNYKVARDAVADSQWERSFNASNDQWERNFNNSNDQWNKEFAYKQARDAVADSQWEKEYQLAVQKAKAARSGGSGGSGGKTTTQNNVSNSQSMTFTDSNKHLIAMMGMNESDAASYAKSLQQNGYISKEDANYLYQEYLNKKKANSKTGTTLDIINGIYSVG